MTSSKKSPEVKKYYVDPDIVDNLIRLYNQQVDSILLMSTKKCDPHELQYAMARAAGFQQSIQYLTMNMTEETKNGITLLKTGQRTFSCGTCPTGACSEDRGIKQFPPAGTDQYTKNRNSKFAKPKPKDSRHRWWKFWK